jgi:hypothetical protein
MVNLKMSAGELADLAAWVEQQGLKRNHEVRLEQVQTGIGCTLVGKIHLTEDSGIFKDFTDYDTW